MPSLVPLLSPLSTPSPISISDPALNTNAPNSWSVSSYDPKLGLIYLPMGNESPDQYGADRSEAVEKYSSSILALNAETGEVVWSYQ